MENGGPREKQNGLDSGMEKAEEKKKPQALCLPTTFKGRDICKAGISLPTFN